MAKTNLSLPEQTVFALPRDRYDIRCIDAKMTETAKDKHPMLAMRFEIVAPQMKRILGRDEPVEIVGIEVRYWLVFYGKAIEELSNKGDLTDEEVKQLEHFKNCQRNPRYGTLVKLGAMHASMGLSLEDFDEDAVDTSLYIGKTCSALLSSKVETDVDSSGKPLIGINGKPLLRSSINIDQFLGPATMTEQHPAF